MLFHIKHGNITIDIEDGYIANITRGKSDENAIELDVLDATFEAIHIDRTTRKLHLDGLALTDLATWLHVERAAKFKAEAHRLLKFFPGSSNISDMMRAVCSIVLGIDHDEPGEHAYFAGKVRRAHPVEFAELRAHWMAQSDKR